MVRTIEVLGHRTGMAHAPENSIEGFRHCHENGAAAVECDITFIADVPYVWAAGTKESEPTLLVREVLEFVGRHSGMTVYFDVKFYTNHIAGHFLPVSDDIVRLVGERVIRPAMTCDVADRIGFVTFCGGTRLLRAAKLLDPRIATDLMVIFPWTRVQEYRTYVDAITIGWDKDRGNHWKFFPRSLRTILSQARSMGIRVRGGLANTVPDVDWLLEQGADGIWTDDVPFVRSYLSNSPP